MGKKKGKKKGLSTGAKIGIGLGAISLAGLGAVAYKASKSSAGQWIGRNAANRSRYKIQRRGRWN